MIMLPDFAHPWALHLLGLVPLVTWWYARQPRAAWLFSDAVALPSVGQGRARRARWFGALLRLLGLAALIVALAGPRWPDPGSRIPTEGAALALVLDVSGSMAEEDFVWDAAKVSRFEAARRMLRLLVSGGPAGDSTLPGRPDDLVALVSFATQPETACPLTLDHKALLEILDVQTTRSAAHEGTSNPGDAVAWTVALLQQAPVPGKAIVLVTDGESNVPEGLRPRQAAQLAGNLRVPVYAIDTGPDSDEEGARQARAALQSLTQITGGAYAHARDAAALQHACREIERLQKDVVPALEYRRYYEGYAWFALLALVCWSTVLALEATRWRQVP